MRTPYYHSAERQAAFLAEVKSWSGTPFREHGAVKGPLGGVSCCPFAAKVHVACGAVEAVEIPTLPVEWVRSWHKHNAESHILEFFALPSVRARLGRVEMDEGAPMIGDMVVMQFDKTVHHLGLWCGPVVAHIGIPGGYMVTSVKHPEYRTKFKALYRIYGA